MIMASCLMGSSFNRSEMSTLFGRRPCIIQKNPSIRDIPHPLSQLSREKNRSRRFIFSTAKRSFPSSPSCTLRRVTAAHMTAGTREQRDELSHELDVGTYTTNASNQMSEGTKISMELGSVATAIIDPIRDTGEVVKSQILRTFKEDLKVMDQVSLAKAASAAKEHMMSWIMDTLYKPDYTARKRSYMQDNFGPVVELGERVELDAIEGAIPLDFPAGVFIRIGSNPQFPAASVNSPFGVSKWSWFEGDGMLHATYFQGGAKGAWYKNKYVETDSYKVEKARGKQMFLPTLDVEGACRQLNPLLNLAMLGDVNKCMANTKVVHHAGKVIACDEAHLPTEIRLDDLATVGTWDFGGSWKGPSFSAHPKIDPETKEMVVYAFGAVQPYLVFGVYSGTGKLIHKVDVEIERAAMMHDIAITPKYNIVFNFPLTMDMGRFARGGPLIDYEANSYARIGVMPRFGDSKSMQWFDVSNLGYSNHTLNAFEQDEEVVVRSCRLRKFKVEVGEGWDLNKIFFGSLKTFKAEEGMDYSQRDHRLVSNLYEWRLNLKTGAVSERILSEEFQKSVEFPVINDNYLGKDLKYGYAIIQDPALDSEDRDLLGLSHQFVKFHFHEQDPQDLSAIKMEIHDVGENRYVGEAAFVPRRGATEEDDGWLVTYMHDEETLESEVYILDAQHFEEAPVARLRLPQRVPYGFHSTFIPV